jgi:hypothetical protein
MENKKFEEAKKIVEGCIGKNGVWASSFRYKYQCWTRDFVIATEDLLLEWGREDIVKKHLQNLAGHQYQDGRMPIMFLDDTLRWLAIKTWNSIRNRRVSFLLKGYFSKDGVGQLSPWTKDSEILFALGVMKYVIKTDDRKFLDDHKERVGDALHYVEKNLMKDGLVFGGDWRDTRPDLNDKFLLTNNCFLFHAYTLLGEVEKAGRLKKVIHEKYWTGSHYRDYLGVDDFDTLGNALAVLFDIAPRECFSLVLAGAEKLDTPYGYKLNGVTLPPKSKEETEVMLKTNQFGVIWPFIHGFMILAALKAGDKGTAVRQFKKWTNLDGFFEFYDPLTGHGHGSAEQVWSAALYLRVQNALEEVL